MKILRGARITAVFKTRINAQNDIDKILDIIDNVCWMLSIIVGTRINWLRWRLYDKKGRLIREFYSERRVNLYSSSVIFIDNRKIPLGLKKYLEDYYDSFVQSRDKFQLHRFIDYVIATIQPQIMETRFLGLLGGLEILTYHVLLNSPPPLQMSAAQLQGRSGPNLEQKMNRIYNMKYPFVSKCRWGKVRKDMQALIRNPLMHRGMIDLQIFVNQIGRYNELLQASIMLYLKLLGYRGRLIDISRGHNVLLMN